MTHDRMDQALRELEAAKTPAERELVKSRNHAVLYGAGPSTIEKLMKKQPQAPKDKRVQH